MQTQAQMQIQTQTQIQNLLQKVPDLKAHGSKLEASWSKGLNQRGSRFEAN